MSKQVLVVDDDSAIRKSFVLALEDTNCQVDTAESGEQCLEKASENKYDLIFLDLKMPGINGVETLFRLRDSGYKNLIYLLTAFHREFTDQLRVAADKGYEFEIVKKPIGSQDIIALTNAALEGVGLCHGECLV